MIISGDNLVKQCDVGIHVADNSAPAIRYEQILEILCSLIDLFNLGTMWLTHLSMLAFLLRREQSLTL